MHALTLVVALMIAIGVGSVAAKRLGLPAPVVLVGLGSLLSLVPALAGVRLPPEAVLLIFLPVLLYWDALTTSLREIRRLFRGILLTGTLLVIVTAAAIATVLHGLGCPGGWRGSSGRRWVPRTPPPSLRWAGGCRVARPW